MLIDNVVGMEPFSALDASSKRLPMRGKNGTLADGCATIMLASMSGTYVSPVTAEMVVGNEPEKPQPLHTQL